MTSRRLAFAPIVELKTEPQASMKRAKEGFRRLYEFVSDLRADRDLPAEGVFTFFLRHPIRWPEILA